MWARLRSFFKTLTRRQRFEDTLSGELRFHLDIYADDLIESGLSRGEAYRQARVYFGSVERVRDECRQACGVRLIDELRRDLRSGVRQLGRRPGFTTVAVRSLAVGIGANTAIFSVVNTVLLREVPLDRPEDLVNVYLNISENGYGVLSEGGFE